jgi:hypothetical protein
VTDAWRWPAVLVGGPLDGETVGSSHCYNGFMRERVSRPFRGVTLDADEVPQVLRELHKTARTVRGSTPLDHPSRKASETLSALLAHLHANGWSGPSLDAALGARPGVARHRMARHGYLKIAPSEERARYRGEIVSSPGRPRLDIAGQRFYALTAVAPTGETTPGGSLWLFRCNCGNERVAATATVKAGKIKACARTCSAQRA